MIALLIHIYYSNSWESFLKNKIIALQKHSPLIMINLCLANPDNAFIISTIRKDFPNAIIITTPNKGKDIGGKLALIDFFIKTNQKSEYIIFLHDKISPHSVTGEMWRMKLYSIIDAEKIRTIISRFQNKPEIGVIGAKSLISNEFDKVHNRLKTTNNDKINELLKKYNLNVTNFTFIVGTMFWIRSTIIKNFFLKYPPLSCREALELGNTTDQYKGTYTHSWERILCWLADSQKYTLKGI